MYRFETQYSYAFSQPKCILQCNSVNYKHDELQLVLKTIHALKS